MKKVTTETYCCVSNAIVDFEKKVNDSEEIFGPRIGVINS